jgi:hypothetical protein
MTLRAVVAEIAERAARVDITENCGTSDGL